MARVPGSGRLAFVPTEQMRLKVSVMAACGVQQAVMCLQIINPQTQEPIDLKTLRKAFREELDNGGEVANSLVVQSLFQKATGKGNQSVTAAIWWTKCRMGWKETVVSENHNFDETENAGKEIARRLLRPAADSGAAAPPGATDGARADGAALHLGRLVGTPGADSAA
jgi:hypothetical protein